MDSYWNTGHSSGAAAVLSASGPSTSVSHLVLPSSPEPSPGTAGKSGFPADTSPCFDDQTMNLNSTVYLTPPSAERQCTSSSEGEISFDGLFANTSGSSEHLDITKPKVKKTKYITGKKQVPGLQFPPCLVCGGKSSGYHFGVTTCEACKAFFRRYLIGNEVTKCKKNGNCKVINRSRGNCSGCRLQKCLAVGMAKEKSKLGRYSVSKRSETIELMNKYIDISCKSGNSTSTHNDMNADTNQEIKNEPKESDVSSPEEEVMPDKEEYVMKILENSPGACVENVDDENCIEILAEALDHVRPYGPNITNDDELQAAFEYYRDKHELKMKHFGQMKPVPREEHELLLKKYGIDVDDRYRFIRDCYTHIESLMTGFCSFAKLLPGFTGLCYSDQVTLLKAHRADFLCVVGWKSYHSEYDILIYNGTGVHYSEITGGVLSEDLAEKMKRAYKSLQYLNLTKRKRAILSGMVVMQDNRGNLNEVEKVRSIRKVLEDMMWQELVRVHGPNAEQRYSDISVALTRLNDFSNQHMIEYNQACQDPTFIREAPMMTEFLLENNS